MKKVIIDTNIWMALSERKFDLFGELKRVLDFPYEICVLFGTIMELKKIVLEQRGRFRQAAKLALELIKAKKIRVIRGQENSVDENLVRLSGEGNLILTLDLALKRRLVKPYLALRQGRKIMVER